MTVKCPYCGIAYDIEENKCGCRACCEVCGKWFVIGHAPPLVNVASRTNDRQQHNKKKDSSWNRVGYFIVICFIIVRTILGCHNKKQDEKENVPPKASSDHTSDHLGQSSEKRLGRTSMSQKSLDVQQQWHGDENDYDTAEAIVTKADLIVQRRQKEDSLIAEKVKIAEHKQQRQMEVFLTEMKKNGGDKEAARRAAETKVPLSAEDMMSLADSIRLTAKEKGDPSIIRDFEAAFKNTTGMTINMEEEDDEEDEEEDEEEEEILSQALAYVEKRYQQKLRRYGLTETNMEESSIEIPKDVKRQLLQDHARIKAYKKELSGTEDFTETKGTDREAHVASVIDGNPLRKFRFGESGNNSSMRLSGFHGFEKITLGYTSQNRLFSICLTASKSSDYMVRALMRDCDLCYPGLRWNVDTNYKGELFASGQRRDSHDRVELFVSIIPLYDGDVRIQVNIFDCCVKRIDDGDT